MIRLPLTVSASVLLLCTQAGSAQQDSVMIRYFSGAGVALDSCSYLPLYDALCSWMETPYRYAGHSVGGVDCSGLVKIIYKNIYNTELLGSASSIYLTSRIEETALLTEGDLVFFRINGQNVSHVGIYLSGNKFAHASVKKGVCIDDLNEPYYKKRFSGGGVPQVGLK